MSHFDTKGEREMKEKVINAMIIEAMAKLCESKCKDSEGCNSMCEESQYLLDMIVKYPVLELDLEDDSQSFDTSVRKKE